jgi:hypothetical protein
MKLFYPLPIQPTTNGCWRPTPHGTALGVVETVRTVFPSAVLTATLAEHLAAREGRWHG